jgi:hypothetical protein
MSGFRHAQTTEVTQCDEFGLHRFLCGQSREGFVHREQVELGRLSDGTLGIEINTLHPATSLVPPFCPGVLNRNPPHGFGCSRKEMAAGIPVLSLVHVYQPNVSVVDEYGGLERLPRLLLGQPSAASFRNSA